MKKYIKIYSVFIGAGIGFFSFYFIFHLWEMSWEISFLVAFTLGYLAANSHDIYVGKINQTDIEKHDAEKVSRAIDNFENNELL
jgi:hypothetical protein|tara:strand:+ start:393 stop:644 length:252 start_codon:yes stop_codon:yes gene_type:complete